MAASSADGARNAGSRARTARHQAVLGLVLTAAASTTAASSPLRGRVALVTGASRGIGRGIAIELGRAGAEVYVTGRSQRSGTRPADACDDLTIERTAEEVCSAGGVGHYILCDHADDASVRAAFERISSEQDGGLDLLVNNAFSTDQLNEGEGLRAPFWVQGVKMWDMVHGVGLRSHFVCSCEAVPLMMARGGGLMVQISSFGGSAYIFNVPYGVAKGALDRMALDMHIELRPHGISTVSLYPGLVQTERNLQLEREGKWEHASGGLDLAKGETPAFTGKAVVALATAAAEDLRGMSGSVQVVAELAERFGFADEGGRRPSSIRSLRYLLPNYVFPQMRKQGVPLPNWLDDALPDIKLPWAAFKSGPPPASE